MPKKDRLAFVLAGGGSLGSIQVGILQELVDYGVKPDLVVGASVGAINGAFFAGNPTADGVAKLVEIWKSITRRRVFPLAVTESLLSFAGRGNNTVSPQALRNLIENNLTHRTIEEIPVEFHAVATNVLTGEVVVLSKGDTVEALLASAAIPAVFPPVERDGVFLVDGGVADMTPIATAAELGATRIIVLHTGHTCALKEPPGSLVSMGLHVLNLMISGRLAVEAELLAGKVKIAIPPPLCPLAVTPFDFGQTRELMERAADTTRAWLKQGGLDEVCDHRSRLMH